MTIEKLLEILFRAALFALDANTDRANRVNLFAIRLTQLLAEESASENEFCPINAELTETLDQLIALDDQQSHALNCGSARHLIHHWSTPSK